MSTFLIFIGIQNSFSDTRLGCHAVDYQLMIIIKIIIIIIIIVLVMYFARVLM